MSRLEALKVPCPPLRPQSPSDARVFAAVAWWARVVHRRIFHRLAEDEATEGIEGRVQSPILPLCLNDKYTWRKLFDRDPRFVALSDKLATKAWIEAEGFDIDNPRTLWAGRRAKDIPRDLLSRPGHLKANNASGRNIALGPDAPPPDEILAKARGFLKKGYGRGAGQWGYYKVPRRIFIEEDLSFCGPALDIKCYVYGGKVLWLAVLGPAPDAERAGDVYTMGPNGPELTKRQFKPHYPLLRYPLPAATGRAVKLAAEIGGRFDHMRVDFLTDGENLWMGELTVYPRAGIQLGFGTDPAHPAALAWDLRQSWFMQTPQRGWREAYRRALRRSLDAATSAAEAHG